MAAPAFAASQVTSVTVEQVSQFLITSGHEKDAKLARQLSTLQLTERADQETLAKWRAKISGKQTRRALTELADASAFLPLPKSASLANSPPAPVEMQDIIDRAIRYVNQAVPRLPDFYALRTTTHFEDAPALQQDVRNACKGAAYQSLCLANAGANTPPIISEFNPLHFEGATTATVTYRDGQEVTSQHFENAFAPRQQQYGLVTTGEFGPILVVVLGDALHGKVFWDSWQQSPAGPLAVFRYVVSKEKSHFMVSCPSVSGAQEVIPAYHGEFAIAPSTGTVYRITMISDLEPPLQDQEASIAVEYESVPIGGASYICPVRGVAFSRVPVFSSRLGKIVKMPLMQTRLNDVTFTRFHLFRAEMKILSEAGGRSLSTPAQPEAQAH